MAAETSSVVTRQLAPPPHQRRALQQALAAAVVELLRSGGACSEQPGGLLRTSSESALHRPPRAIPKSQVSDPLLTSILRGAGGVQAAVERCQAIAEAKGPGRLRAAVAAALPQLSEGRLRVFVELLSSLCRAAPRRGGVAASTAAAAACADAVANAVLDAGVGHLPCETEDQLISIRASPYVSQSVRHALLEMLVPASACMRALASGGPSQLRDDEVLHQLMVNADSPRSEGAGCTGRAAAAAGLSPRFARMGDMAGEEASSSATGCTPRLDARMPAPLRSPTASATPRGRAGSDVPALSLPTPPLTPTRRSVREVGELRDRDDAVLSAIMAAPGGTRRGGSGRISCPGVGSDRGGDCGGRAGGVPPVSTSRPPSSRQEKEPSVVPSPKQSCRLADFRTAPLRTSWSVTELGCAASRFRRMAGA